jgi:ankyrin repeat protein
VRQALSRGADVHAKEPGEGQTALHLACRRSWKAKRIGVRTLPVLGDVASAIRLLIEAGARATAADNDGITPPHWAAGQGMADICRVLIQAGANVNARDSSRYTPLHQAASGHLEAARVLVEAGAEINAKSAHGETALWFAEQNRAVDSSGRDPNEPLQQLIRQRGGVT